MLTDLSRIQEDDILFNGVGFVAVARLSVSGIDGRIFFAVTLCYFCEESVVFFWSALAEQSWVPFSLFEAPICDFSSKKT